MKIAYLKFNNDFSFKKPKHCSYPKQITQYQSNLIEIVLNRIKEFQIKIPFDLPRYIYKLKKLITTIQDEIDIDYSATEQILNYFKYDFIDTDSCSILKSYLIKFIVNRRNIYR